MQSARTLLLLRRRGTKKRSNVEGNIMTSHRKKLPSDYGFSTPGFDWEVYSRVRPRYPQSLYDEILKFHEARHGEFETAHDIGAGHGVVTENFLMNHFDHIWASDPVPYNLAAAKHFLRGAISDGKVTPVEAAAEDEWLPSSSVDLVTAFEVIQWTDPELSIPVIAQQLKPGGTFAALYYNPLPFTSNSDRAQRAWMSIGDKCGTLWHESGEYLPRAYDGLNMCCPVPEDLFESGAKRIRLNAKLLEQRESPLAKAPFKLGASHDSKEHRSVVSQADVCESWVDEEGWSAEVEAEWFQSLLKSFHMKPPSEEVRAELDSIASAAAEKGGKLKIVWVVDIVLATRRMDLVK